MFSKLKKTVTPSVDILDSDFNDLDLFSFNGLTLRGKITDIYDGDTMTIVVLFRGEPTKYKLRMLGYDSPEMKPRKTCEHRDLHKQAGKKVRDYLREKYINKKVWIKFVKEDKYGRLLGEVFDDEQCTDCLNTKLINMGYGKGYDGGTKQEFTEEELLNIINN